MIPEPEEFLPLRPVEFQILVSLATEDLHGYGIVQAAKSRGEGTAVPGLVTLYRALDRMEGRGLVGRVASVVGADHLDTFDDRRRVFRITPLGTRVLRSEALRLSMLVRSALEVAGATGEEDA